MGFEVDESITEGELEQFTRQLKAKYGNGEVGVCIKLFFSLLFIIAYRQWYNVSEAMNMERRGKGLIPFEADEKEVTERAKRLIDEWSKEPNRLNKKRLGVLKELFAQKRIADEAGLTEWKWHILWSKLDQSVFERLCDKYNLENPLREGIREE